MIDLDIIKPKDNLKAKINSLVKVAEVVEDDSEAAADIIDFLEDFEKECTSFEKEFFSKYGLMLEDFAGEIEDE